MMVAETFVCVSEPMVWAGAALVPGSAIAGSCDRCGSRVYLSPANRRHRDRLQAEGRTTGLICGWCLSPDELRAALQPIHLAPGTLDEVRAYLARN